MAGTGKGKGKRGEGTTIVVRKIIAGGGGHHGGAWKVAYADFVTAMMAFFLLMWLLNATTEQQRRGLADFFSPNNVLGQRQSGNGQPFGGRTPNSDGAAVSDAGAVRIERGPAPVLLDIEEDEAETTPADRPPPPQPPGDQTGLDNPGPDAVEPNRGRPATAGAAPAAGALPGDATEAFPGHAAARSAGGQGAQGPAAAGPRPDGAADRLSEAALRAELARRERADFERVERELRAAVQDDPALADLARQLLVEQTPEGLRIQLLDAERQSMFALGGAAPNDRARQLIQRVAQIIARVPNGIAIAGHTDATPFRGPGSNWDLSADRANAVRRLLMDSGVPPGRIRSVSGLAEREPLLAEEPNAAGNRRVAITLIRNAPPPAAPAR